MNNEEKMLHLLSNLTEKIDNLDRGQKQMQADIDKLNSDMSEVKANVKYIWEDISRQEKRIDKIAR